MKKFKKNNSWKIEKLGEVIKLEYGKPLNKSKRNSDGKYSVYGANGIIAKSNEYYFNKKSIIVGRKGSAGELNITDAKFWPLDVTYFVTFNEKKYDLMFLFYLLKKLNLPSLAKGVKPGINRNDVYAINIPVPPLPEQKRIVKILNKAFAAIDRAKENAEKNLQNSKELFDSYLQSVFAEPGKAWEIKNLGEVYDITSSKRVYKSEWKREGVPFYRAREIVKLSKQGYVDNELFISEEMYQQYSFKYGIPKENDMMVTGVGTLGICYVVKKNDKFYFKDGNIIWLKSKGLIYSRFVEYAFKSVFIRKQIDDSIGATVGTYTIIKAKNTLIPFPPLSEQKRIVKILDSLCAKTKLLESKYQQKLADLEELKKSILHKSFKGAL